MTSPSSRLSLAFKALRQLGLRPVGAYAWYQLELHSGLLRWRTPLSAADSAGAAPAAILQPILSGLPDRDALASTLTEAGCQRLLLEAEEITAGQVRLFGGPPVPLRLELTGPQKHWSARQPVPEGFQPPGEPPDIKWVWEPARFAWAVTLARAWLVTADERFPASFWSYTEAFLQANPANLGANWASAQEVALRLMALCLVWQVFSASPETTPERTSRLSQAIAEHAARIPPTMAYARAQNNNHLLAEAAGLYTAAVFLPDHPSAPRWRSLGWKWFNLGLQSQVATDGAYTQNSASYQRLALQLGLFVDRLSHSAGHVLPPASLNALARLTQWLLSLVDGLSGQVPNLGPNDGAYFLPLTARPYQDYRPALQAASRAFSGVPAFAPGEWDEMALWLAHSPDSAPASAGDIFQPGEPSSHSQASPALDASPHVLRPGGGDAWAYLRVARFTSRPGHADQLHFDLWWRGLNLARDAGTYLYNAPTPWNNSLARTSVHNTVTLHGQDQMTWAGRFLWLDWAQGQVLSRESAADGSLEQMTAYHDGYRRAGVIHQRSVEGALCELDR